MWALGLEDTVVLTLDVAIPHGVVSQKYKCRRQDLKVTSPKVALLLPLSRKQDPLRSDQPRRLLPMGSLYRPAYGIDPETELSSRQIALRLARSVVTHAATVLEWTLQGKPHHDSAEVPAPF